jgi:predicted SAM-dependent methyltransferase
MAGFVNMDLMPGPGAIRADIGRHIPVPNRSVKGLFAEHVFEHLDYHTEVTRFLSECRRVMLPGARMRIVVPDAGAYIAAYASGHWDEYVRMRPLLEGRRDYWLGEVYRTRMELINAVFRQGNEHKYAYDAETLIVVLQAAGFIEVERKNFGQSGDPALLIDTPERASESLYVEAVNP